MQMTCYYYWRDLSKWTTGEALFSMFLRGLAFSRAGEYSSGFWLCFHSGVWNEIIAQSLCVAPASLLSFLVLVIYNRA